MIAGIVLAAGAARRMGKPKQILPIENQPMVWRVANAACNSRLDSVTLVTGAECEAIAAATQGLPLTLIHNENWASGQATSLIAGIKNLSDNTQAVMFLLADQPLVTPSLINTLIDVYHHSCRSIICSQYAEQNCTPVLFDWNRWKKALTTLSGDQGARKIIAAHPDCVHSVPVISGELLWDVDTEEDYRRICDAFYQRRQLP